LADRDADIAIAGGGLVGAALTLALAQRGFSVAVIESREPDRDWAVDSYDLRVSAITRASQQLFDNLGVWSAILADRATPYRSMHVWDQAGLGEIHFDAADIGEPDLGHIVENRVMLRALWQALDGLGVSRYLPRTIVEQHCSADGVLLRLDDGEALSVGLLVGADGARSKVRDRAGIAVTHHDYGQQAVVATVRAELGNRATAWQRFLRTGPLALLPMEKDLFSIVWSTTPDEAQRLLGLDSEAFGAALTDASESRLGRLTLLGERAAFALRAQHATRYVQPGLALVGDAAHVIHPLAGQGVNLGFLDAAVLVDALVAGRAVGRAPGALRTLRPYERARRGHNTATQLAMDGFKQLFGHESRALSLLRNTGLGLVGRLGPVRRRFEHLALGQGIELPALCRPGPVTSD
jgi:2-octaprenylphenol hydroxylase